TSALGAPLRLAPWWRGGWVGSYVGAGRLATLQDECRAQGYDHPPRTPPPRGVGRRKPASLTDVDSDYTPNEVAELLARDEVDLIDVREPDEYEAGRIARARHIPLAQLPEEVADLNRERPIVFYCRSGSRSAMATEAFRLGSS